MKLKVDEQGLYLRLDESAIVEAEEVQPGVVLDFNERNQVVGVEILGSRDRLPREMLRTLHFETV